jgi:H+-transporting ATPase
VAQTFGLLVIGMEWLSNPDWQAWITLTKEQIQTVIFLQIVAGGHLLYFVMRSRETIFSPPWPAAPVFWAIVGTQIFAVLMVGFGWFVPAIPWTIIGLVWLYMLVWMVVLDLVKLALYRRLRHETSRPPWYERFIKRRHAARALAETAKVDT